MRLVHYQYKPEFAATVGIENTAETGNISQVSCQSVCPHHSISLSSIIASIFHLFSAACILSDSYFLSLAVKMKTFARYVLLQELLPKRFSKSCLRR